MCAEERWRTDAGGRGGRHVAGVCCKLAAFLVPDAAACWQRSGELGEVEYKEIVEREVIADIGHRTCKELLRHRDAPLWRYHCLHTVQGDLMMRSVACGRLSGDLSHRPRKVEELS